MKIDRLLGIVIYLLNRKKVNAGELAKHFEVSVRTIQRDIDSLSAAGIPVYASHGAAGGYGIIDSYTLNKQIMNLDDLFFIFTALKSLCSAYDNKKILRTLEKIKAVYAKVNIEEYNAQELYIDFTAFSESKNMKQNFPLIEQAIKQNRLLEFDYTTSNHRRSHRIIEPMTIAFKWYTWYLLSYCRTRADYRMFSISRIRNIEILDEEFERRPIDTGDFFNPDSKKTKEESLKLKLRFNNEIKIAIENYFSSGIIMEESDEYSILEIMLPKNEQYWLGMIMSFGNKIKILEPESLKKRMVEKVREIKEIYDA